MRRLLVIANPFPPMVSAGTMRVQRFLRHLPEHGWEPTVLTATARGDAPVPRELRVWRAPAPVPRLLLRGPRGARLNRWLFVPDPYILWAGPAIAAGLRLLRRERYDALMSSAPRASVHLVAASLSRASGLPWLADYRDPWLNYEYTRYPTPLHRRANALLEHWAMGHAAAVTAINDAILGDVIERVPCLAPQASVVPNGFDRVEKAADVDLGPGFWFVHTGRLYGRDDQTEAFVRAFAKLPADTNLLFVGVDEGRIRPLAERYGAAGRVHVRPFLPHAESLGYQRAADALLLIAGRQRETTTSKVYEYLLSGRPIFAVGPRGSAVDRLFAEVGGGLTVEPEAQVAEELAAFVAAVREGAGPAVDPAKVARYDVEHTTAQLAAVLDGLLAQAGEPPAGSTS